MSDFQDVNEFLLCASDEDHKERQKKREKYIK